MYNGKLFLLIWCLGANVLLVAPRTAIAQSQSVDPLLVDRNDPLIPLGYGKRKLTSFEKYRIEQKIAELDIAAKTALDRDNIDRAVKLWYRQLRLARSLGRLIEIEALGNVGKSAWSENRGQEVRNIAERLQDLEKEITADKTPADLYLKPLAKAYQQVGYLDKAIDIYQQIIATGKNSDREDRRKLGQLYLALFDYQRASQVYQKLVNRGNEGARQSDLDILIDIYERTQKYEDAIAIRAISIEQYSARGKTKKIPVLEIATARNYEALEQTDKAILAYDRAFNRALKIKHLAIANDALQSIGLLYQKQGKLDKAIATYNRLLLIQQQSYNHYGLIASYDALGQIYLKLDKNNLAKRYFQQGLDLAKSLNYKVKYFEDKIK